MIEKIKYKNKLFALIVSGNYRNRKGITFFTPDDTTQQFGYMKHKKKHIIKLVRVLVGQATLQAWNQVVKNARLAVLEGHMQHAKCVLRPKKYSYVICRYSLQQI